MKVLSLIATPRKNGNSEILSYKAIDGAKSVGIVIENIYMRDLFIKPCKGCLRCNILGYCSIKDDDFNNFKDKFFESSGVILSAPIYYHYIPGTLKILLDRFRSTVYVKIKPEELVHTLKYKDLSKKFLFIVTLGNPHMEDALPALEAMKLWSEMTCEKPVIIKPLIATFLALPGQINSSKERLKEIFSKMEIPLNLVDEKYELYQKFLKEAYEKGMLFLQNSL